MKLIVVFSVEEYREQLDRLFRQAGVPVFSRLSVEGVKLSDSAVKAAGNWFGAAAPPADAFANLTFTTEEQAAALMAQIESYNEANPTSNPFRAFQMPVEAHV